MRCKMGMFAILDLMYNVIIMDDDAKLKILFYSMILLSAVAIVGVWESFVKPLIGFFTGFISIV